MTSRTQDGPSCDTSPAGYEAIMPSPPPATAQRRERAPSILALEAAANRSPFAMDKRELTKSENLAATVKAYRQEYEAGIATGVSQIPESYAAGRERI